jgi:hypothetical protein
MRFHTARSREEGSGGKPDRKPLLVPWIQAEVGPLPFLQPDLSDFHISSESRISGWTSGKPALSPDEKGREYSVSLETKA